jgi:hypothetical protein
VRQRPSARRTNGFGKEFQIREGFPRGFKDERRRVEVHRLPCLKVEIWAARPDFSITSLETPKQFRVLGSGNFFQTIAPANEKNAIIVGGILLSLGIENEYGFFVISNEFYISSDVIA